MDKRRSGKHCEVTLKVVRAENEHKSIQNEQQAGRRTKIVLCLNESV